MIASPSRTVSDRWFRISVLRRRRFSEITSATSTRAVISSPILTGPRKFSVWDRYRHPGPGSFIPITAEMSPADSIPCAIRSPNRVFSANSLETCTGL